MKSLIRAIELDSKLIRLVFHDHENLVHAALEIELKEILSELSSTYLGVIENVIYKEAKDFFTAHLNGYGLPVTAEDVAQFCLKDILGTGHLTHGFLKNIVYHIHFLNLRMDRVDRVSHFVANSCIDQGEETSLTHCHLV